MEKGVDLFLQLSSLELHNMNLESGSFIARSPHAVPVCAALIAMLIRRKSLGSPILRLHLTGCETPSQVDSHLAEIVPDIVEVESEEQDIDWDATDVAMDESE